MSTTPPRETESKQRGTGSRLLLLGGILFAVGLLIVLLVDGGTPEGIGIAFMSLATVPTLAGVALMLSSIVAKRSREGKPWA